MGVTDDLLAKNAEYADSLDRGHLGVKPTKHVAVVSCMDARIDLYSVLGLGGGEAHLLRNAGGIVTDDVIRSLAISQRMLDTRTIIVIQHTDCGMGTFTDVELADELERDTGVRPMFAIGAFTDVEASVRASIGRIRSSPFIPHTDDLRGFVYDVDHGGLREVSVPAPTGSAPQG
jgi:carbonic anhydrase